MMTVIFHDIKMSSLQWISKCAPDIISYQLSASSDPSNSVLCPSLCHASNKHSIGEPKTTNLCPHTHPAAPRGCRRDQRFAVPLVHPGGHQQKLACRNLMFFPKEKKGTWAFVLLTKKKKGGHLTWHTHGFVVVFCICKTSHKLV